MKRSARRKAAAEEEAGSSDGEAVEEMKAAGLVKAAEARGQYKVEGLQQSLEDIQRELPWVETLDVVARAPLGVTRIEDDLQREVAFYNQALANVKQARAKLDTLGEPHKRPTDYFAQMLKADSHMQRVKDKLIFEQKKMAAVDQRKREQEQRQYAKAVQAEKLKDRQKSKKAATAALQRLAKRKRSAGGAIDDTEVDEILARTSAGHGAGAGSGGGRDGKDAKGKPSWRRRRKNEKFGMGGKERGWKRNDKSSTGKSHKDFNLKRNRDTSGIKKKKGPKNRPGKKRRTSARAARS